MDLLAVIVLSPLTIIVMYTGSKWNRWYRGFKRGNASQEDFKDFIKWAGVSLGVAIISLPFILMVGK